MGVAGTKVKMAELLLLTLLHSEWPKLYGVLAILSAIGLNVYLLRSLDISFKYGSL